MSDTRDALTGFAARIATCLALLPVVAHATTAELEVRWTCDEGIVVTSSKPIAQVHLKTASGVVQAFQHDGVKPSVVIIDPSPLPPESTLSSPRPSFRER